MQVVSVGPSDESSIISTDEEGKNKQLKESRFRISSEFGEFRFIQKLHLKDHLYFR